ncbi:MAG: hypothetical protein K2W93_19495 [Burkholderiaceae bacterium]|nr:hypothetical protein [Burkholderiaceae bacterium]
MTDQLFATLYAPLAAITVALFAGSISLVGLVIAKEGKTSDHRQAWIDALRKELADYYAGVVEIVYTVKALQSEGTKRTAQEEMKAVAEPYRRYATAETSIRLRINAVDSSPVLRKLNSELLSSITKIEDLFGSSEFTGFKESEAIMDEAGKLISTSSMVLKLEWERVKAGERWYRWTKWISAAVMFGSLCGIAYVGFRGTNAQAMGANATVSAASAARAASAVLAVKPAAPARAPSEPVSKPASMIEPAKKTAN